MYKYNKSLLNMNINNQISNSSNRMEESTSSENVWCKTKADEQNNLYHPESITQSMEANSTSLADIFDTAFSSTVDPSPQPRFNSGKI